MPRASLNGNIDILGIMVYNRYNVYIHAKCQHRN